MHVSLLASELCQSTEPSRSADTCNNQSFPHIVEDVVVQKTTLWSLGEVDCFVLLYVLSCGHC